MASIYIHIPFCRSICSYCDFTKVIYNEALVNAYLNKLQEEVEDFYDGEIIKTLYIGGGTPSCLTSSDLQKIKEIVDKINFSDNYEFTFECNIEDITKELLTILREMKVNRLSIGIESFNKCKLEFMNRKCDFKDVKEKMKLIRDEGFDNVSLDLIYGIPKEKLKDLKQDIDLLLELNPEHISTYSLIIEEHTMCSVRNDSNIKPEEEVKMYEYIVERLKKNGYYHYEVSNFSKFGYESDHNLVYWNNEEYYGFGLGAAGYVNGFRYENTKNFREYLNGHYKFSEKLIGKQEKMENEVMLGLRKMEGIDLKEFFDKYNVNIQDVFPVKPLLKSKELLYEDGNIFINPKYIYVMNEILLKLI